MILAGKSFMSVMAAFYAICETAFSHGGLFLNVEKCGLLLPECAPEPSPEVRATFPALFDVRTDGFRVAGSPIGNATFVVEAKLFECLRKLEAIKEVGYRSPKAAHTHRLMTTCAVKLMGFLGTTVPRYQCSYFR